MCLSAKVEELRPPDGIMRVVLTPSNDGVGNSSRNRASGRHCSRLPSALEIFFWLPKCLAPSVRGIYWRARSNPLRSRGALVIVNVNAGVRFVVHVTPGALRILQLTPGRHRVARGENPFLPHRFSLTSPHVPEDFGIYVLHFYSAVTTSALHGLFPDRE